MKFLSLGLTAAIIGAVLTAGATAVRADVFNLPAGETSLQFVTVGDPGNQADPLTGFGALPISWLRQTLQWFFLFSNEIGNS
jgi:hypothetical protein